VCGALASKLVRENPIAIEIRNLMVLRGLPHENLNKFTAIRSVEYSPHSKPVAQILKLMFGASGHEHKVSGLTRFPFGVMQ
jgi:hypothetical protein